MPNSNLIQEAILLTLAYSDIFSTPLTFSALHQRLIGYRTTRSQLRQTLDKLLQQGRLEFHQPYYHLPGRKAIIATFTHKQSLSLAKKRFAQSLAQKLALFPSIIAIYLTGSLAVDNASSRDDIDFLIITQPHTLWTTRFFLNLILDVFQLRRRPRQTESTTNKLCLNLFLTSQSLSLPRAKRNLHSAYELIQLKPLIEKQPLLPLIYQHNPWLKSYLPNFNFPSPSSFPLPSPFLHLNFLEPLLFRLQRLYMTSRLTHELIHPQYAFFHPRSLQPLITQQLHQQALRYNITIWPQLRLFLT